MLERFLRDSVTYVAGNILVRGVSIVLVPFYTRVLTPGDYGILDMLTVLAGLVNVTVALEISQGLARHLPESATPDETKGFASTAFWFALGAYSLFFIAANIFAVPLTRIVLGDAGTVAITRVAIGSILLNGMFYLVQNQLRFTMRPGAYSLAGFIYAVVSLGVAVILVLGFKSGVAGFFYGQIAGAVAGLGVGVVYSLQSYALTFNTALLRQMLSFSAPLIPSSIGVFGMVYVDRIAIRKLMTLHDVGLYGVGYRLVSIIAILLIGVQRAVVPLIFAHYKEKETPGQLARIFRLFIGAALLMWGGVTLFSHEILALFTTPAFYEGARVASLLAGATLVSNMYMFMPGLDLAKKTSIVGGINLGGALVNTGLNFALIPLVGIRGSAMATLISASLVFLAYTVYSQRTYPVPHNWGRLLMAAIPAILICAVIDATSSGPWDNLALKIAALFAIVLLVIGTGVVPAREISRTAARIKTKFFGFRTRALEEQVNE